MRSIIQLVLFVAVCAVVFPGACANPVDNEGEAIVKLDEVDAEISLLREETDKADPQCQTCKSRCQQTSCKGNGKGNGNGKSTKKPKTLRDEEMDHADPVCQNCKFRCQSTVCKGGKGNGGKKPKQ